MKTRSLGAALVAAAVVVSVPMAAHAARPPKSPDSSFSITPETPVGIDISFPDCSKGLPANASFVVVGVNGGMATNYNPCMTQQFTWAGGVTGPDVGVPRVQLYINTGNPAAHVAKPSRKYQVQGWPTGSEDIASGETVNGGYGDCESATSTSHGCVWLYGYLRASASVAHFKTQTGGTAADHRWWLDVETANSWLEPREDPQAYTKNVAAIEGFAAGVKGTAGSESYVGVYSNPGSWIPITNTGAAIAPDSPLRQLDTWRTSTSFSSYDAAVTTCGLGNYTGLRPGGLVMTQFVSGDLDYNHSCVAGS